jgi:hypothetical protein
MSRLHYSIVESILPLSGEAVYVHGDHAFNFRPADSAAARQRAGELGTAAITLDTLQVEVGVETGLCLWVSGYSPVTGWLSKAVVAPPIQPGGLQCTADGGLQRGISVRAMDGEPTRYFDPSTGWFCAATTEVWLSTGERAVEVATDTIVLVGEDQLLAIFVRPSNWHELAQGFQVRR